MESYNEFVHPYHIIVEINKDDFPEFTKLTEGRWEPSGEKGYSQRVDQPKFDWQLLHAHIAQDKHINTKNKQVSWNIDRTRHDKKNFNDNFVGMETAKRIARKALGLPNDCKLENINRKNEGELILESVEYLPSKTSIFIFRVIKGNEKRLIID